MSCSLRAIPMRLREQRASCAGAEARRGPTPPTSQIRRHAENYCRRVLAERAPIDVLVNNVGGRNVDAAIEKSDLATWRSMIDLNLTHCFICTKMIGGAMLQRGEGRVINIASISGIIANRGIGGRHYELPKAAIIHFTRATAADWAPAASPSTPSVRASS